MKKLFLKSFRPALFALFSMLVDCPAPPPAPAPAPDSSAKEDREESYEERRRRDEQRTREREREKERSRKRYTGPDCEGDEDCEEICKDIYSARKSRDKCEDLAIDQVEALQEVYEALEKPTDEKLGYIDAVDFEDFVDIDDDARSLLKLMKDLKGSGSEKILAWIVEDSDVADIFKDADDEYKILTELLKNMDSSPQEALGETIEDGKSFIELAIESNSTAIDWIFNMVEEECDGKAYGEELCAFQDWYCKTGLNDDGWTDFLSYSAFEGLMDDILSDYTTAPADARSRPAASRDSCPSARPACWWTAEFGADDLDADDDHFDDLCKWRHDLASPSANKPKIIEE